MPDFAVYCMLKMARAKPLSLQHQILFWSLGMVEGARLDVRIS
jgi:hypothetical protein